MRNPKNTVETIIVAVFFLVLIWAMAEVLRGFVGVFTFALIFSISFATLFEKLAAICKGRRKLAAVIYAVLLLAVVAQPFIYLANSLSHHIRHFNQFITDMQTKGLPPLSPTISHLPYIGQDITRFYEQLQHEPKAALGSQPGPVRTVLHGIITKGAGVLGAAVEIVVGIIISAIMLVNPERMVKPLTTFLEHILGDQEAKVLLATVAQAIKGVSIGIMGTAFIAAAIGWIGLLIAGVPFALGFSALIFFLVIIQIGPMPVWIPITIWLFLTGHNGMGWFMIIYGIFLQVMEYIIKPLLIAKSGKLPFLVLFLGVVGGMMAWGFTGMFKGAIILSIFYSLFNHWLEKKDAQNLRDNSN